MVAQENVMRPLEFQGPLGRGCVPGSLTDGLTFFKSPHASDYRVLVSSNVSQQMALVTAATLYGTFCMDISIYWVLGHIDVHLRGRSFQRQQQARHIHVHDFTFRARPSLVSPIQARGYAETGCVLTTTFRFIHRQRS
ncbi:hypothetical protein TNCT_591441 [Trichonephila clavata]|uniref:Uncharacterized protein n=1 Tax=Trichonephila clavata TaxID=2740835 RepID=A0A8X6J9K6_TRICU|nr:hypothetical protein TNCT_591441 [Trichonephila clavata]